MSLIPTDPPESSASDLPTRLFLGLTVAIGTLALLVRTIDLGSIPPGLHFDQAANGLLGLEILSGQAHPVFFSSYTGREALFFYLIAALEAVLGPNVVAIRLAGALAGTATVVAVIFLGARLVNRRVGLAAGALLAGLYWDIHVSRLGERTSLVPLLDTLALLALWEAFRRRSLPLACLGGALVGLQFYSYPSSRFFPFVLGFIGLSELIAMAFGHWKKGEGPGTPPPVVPPTRGDVVGDQSAALPHGKGFRASFAGFRGLRGPNSLAGENRRGGARPSSGQRADKVPFGRFVVLTIGAVLIGVLVTVPLALHFYHHPADFLGRADEVAIWNPVVAGTSPVSVLATSTRRTLAMFVLLGDRDWKYNLAGRPVFDPISAVFFLLGLVLAVWHWRRRAERICLLWWLGMLTPGFLSVDSPQFMRTLGAAPAAVLFAANGLSAVIGWLARPPQPFAPSGQRGGGEFPFSPRGGEGARGRGVRPLASLLWLWPLFAGAFAAYQYFAVWAPSAAAYLALEGDVTAAAGVIQARADQYPATYVASRYGPDPTIAFLDGGVFNRLHWFDGRSALPLPPPGAGPTLYVLPRTATAGWWYDHLPASDRVSEVMAPDHGPAVEAFVLRPDSLKPDDRSAVPPVDVGGVARLVGVDVPPAIQAGLPAAPAFYWQIERPPSEPVKFFVHLIDSAGQTWAQYDENVYPTTEWRSGQLLIVRRSFPVPSYAPLGTYTLQVGIERKDGTALAVQTPDGQPTGTYWQSQPIQVARPSAPPDPATLPIAQHFDVSFGGTLRLIGATIAPGRVLDGDSVGVSLVWQVIKTPTGNLNTVLQANNAAGQPLARGSQPPTGGVWLPRYWQPGDVIVDRQTLLIPAGTAPGALSLLVGVDATDQQALPIAGKVAGLTPIGTLSVQARPRSTEMVTIPHRQDVAFVNGIHLLGYAVQPTTAGPGQSFQLTLYWQTTRPIKQSFTVFSHVLDAKNQVVAQHDGIPVDAQRPTTTWAPGETIVDRHTLVVQPNAPTGASQLEVGLYDAKTGQRLKTSNGGDRVLLSDSVVIH